MPENVEYRTVSDAQAAAHHSHHWENLSVARQEPLLSAATRAYGWNLDNPQAKSAPLMMLATFASLA